MNMCGNKSAVNFHEICILKPSDKKTKEIEQKYIKIETKKYLKKGGHNANTWILIEIF